MLHRRGTVLTTLQAGDFTIRGISLAGMYTSLAVPELHLLFDVGVPARSLAGCRTLLLSHGHADHAGALPALLGIRALVGKKAPLRLLMPAEIVEPMQRLIANAAEMQRYDMPVEVVGMSPGDEQPLSGDLAVRAIRTLHPVPSLGYLVYRRIPKLRQEFRELDGQEIALRRRRGDDIFDWRERLELGYATDTLVDVLDSVPELTKTRTLILECTFLDDRKPVKTARLGCHIHLDELLERQDLFENEHIVLMHFSQIYKPAEVVEILDRRVPEKLRSRIIPFVPKGAYWPG